MSCYLWSYRQYRHNKPPMAIRLVQNIVPFRKLMQNDSLLLLCELMLRRIHYITESKEPTPAVIKTKIEESRIPFVESHTCFRLQECSLCIPVKKKSAPGRITETYVNKNTGYFLCELCKCCGTWDVFERLLDRKQQVQDNRTSKDVTTLREGFNSYYEKGQQTWRKIVESCVPLQNLTGTEYSDVFSSFKLMECSKSIAEKLNIYVSNNRDTLYIPMLSSTLLVLGYITVGKSLKTSVVPKQDCAGLLVLAPKRKNNSAVIVSNLCDFFSLASLGLHVNIICLPYGVNNLPQVALPFLEQYESLILWLGTSPGALGATRNFAKKLGEKRCSVISVTKNQCSPTSSVESGEDVRKLLREAQPTWHKAITNFSSLRADVYQELLNHDNVLGVRWSRFPSLNKILGGFRRGELTVLTGPTGSGKTTFMSEYSLDLASQGVNTLWGSFEVRNVRLARTMLQQYVGFPLEDNLKEYDAWANSFEELPIYFLTFHGQQNIAAVMDAVQHAAYIHDIAHVIIDNVQFMIGMSEDSKYIDRFHKQDLIIHSFRQFATRFNVHVTLVIHPRKEREADDLTATSIFGGAKAAQEADNVLIIQDKRLTSVKGRKYLQVAKNRYTGGLGIMQLDFDKNSLSFQNRRKTVNKDTAKNHAESHELVNLN